MLKCEYCGNDFKKARKKSKYCSPFCSTKAWYIKKKIENGIGATKECVVCKTLFIKTRKDRICCSSDCSKRYSYTVFRTKETLKPQEVFGGFNNRVEEFLIECKRKRFYFDMIDIFKLVDLHDKIYPSKWLPDSNSDREKYFEEMLNDLINFVKKNKQIKDDLRHF